jgi:hypothetical protein
MTTTGNFLDRAARAVARRVQYVRSGTLRRIPRKWITNEFAFSFADDGWNYFRALITECDQKPELRLEDSIFWRFFQDERVKSVRYLNDILFLHKPGQRDCGFQFALATYPWGDQVAGGPCGHHFDQITGNSTRDLYGHRANIWYKPGDPHPLRLEWEKTRELFDKLRDGYRPLRAGRLPEVTLLMRRDGAYRAMRYNGQHRIAILSHLGRSRLTVLVPSARTLNADLASWPGFSSLPKVVHKGEIFIRETEVNDWPYVKRGLCSREQALEIFHAFFDLNGRERIQALGLAPGY